MKVFALALAIAVAGNVFASGLLQIPACCMHKSMCPMHHSVQNSAPSCHHHDAAVTRVDSKGACLKSCNTVRHVTILMDPALLPVGSMESSAVVSRPVVFAPGISLSTSHLGIPEPPPRA